MSRTAINEEEYFKSIAEMRRSTFGVKAKLRRVHNIFEKVNQSVFNDDTTSESFLYKCYIDAVMEIGGIIKFMFGCAKDGAFHKPNDVGGEDSDDQNDYKDEEYYEKIHEKKEKKQLNMDIFKDAVIRAIIETDKARMKVARALIARANDANFIGLFQRFSPPNLGGENMLVQMYRCLRHIRSGDIDFDYEFSDKDNVVDMFDSVFCSNKTVADYAFFVNVRKSFDEPINKFDMSIITQKKGPGRVGKGGVKGRVYVKEYVWTHTGEVINTGAVPP